MNKDFVLDSFDKQTFLRDFWQQKPCLLKQFMPHFTDPIDEHDLAGLAQESGVDSRIVSFQTSEAESEIEAVETQKTTPAQPAGQWTVTQGPFDEFESVCKGSWSLLVQGVDRYIGEVSELANKVDFLPNWRFDDVMVSFSTANAGVGAHIDEYDVFIVQGRGRRRWQVGLPAGVTQHESNADKSAIQAQFNTLVPHPLLKQIESFDAVIDYELEPGDAIYIPPKHPHKGIALEECLNYSLGFRAPTNLEVLTGMLDESDELREIQTRYSDPDISLLRSKGLRKSEISEGELNKVKQDLQSLLDSEQATHMLLQYLSRQELPNAEQLDIEPYKVSEVNQMIQDRTLFELMPGVKPIYLEQKDEQDAYFCFYIDGVEYTVTAELRESVVSLLNGFPEEVGGSGLRQNDELGHQNDGLGQQNDGLGHQNDGLGHQNDGLGHQNDKVDLKSSWVSLLTQLLNAGAIDVVEDDAF
jgi:50S ribosomal protein L16 3-hydroxylase